MNKILCSQTTYVLFRFFLQIANRIEFQVILEKLTTKFHISLTKSCN